MAVFFFILGIIAFLIMVHPLAFWLVFVPLALLFVAILVNFLRNRRGAIGNLISLMVVFLVMIIALVIVAS